MKLNFQKNILIVAILLIISLALTGCSGNEQEKARSELAKLNIAYTPESFLNCIQNNDTVVFKLFMQVGMDANAKNQEGVTALMLAAKAGNMEMVNSLLSKGAQVNSKAAKGNTALEYAALEGRLDVVKTLLDKGADINNKNDLGVTPLMCAVDKGHAAVVKELIAKSADVNIVAANSHSAYSIAKSKSNKDILDILIQAGAKENQANALKPVNSAATSNSTDIKRVIEGSYTVDYQETSRVNLQKIYGEKIVIANGRLNNWNLDIENIIKVSNSEYIITCSYLLKGAGTPPPMVEAKLLVNLSTDGRVQKIEHKVGGKTDMIFYKQ